MPDTCENCGVEGRLAPVGPGVERLAEEAKALFPDAKIAVLSSDLFSSARSLKAAIAEIANGDIDIIIGTQLVAKGHNFPNLTLVGVIDADLGLQGSDLRAAERTFQLMRQVAGRAGRSEKPGAAYLQTYQPEHPVIRAILGGEEEAFWNAEAAERLAAQVPHLDVWPQLSSAHQRQSVPLILATICCGTQAHYRRLGRKFLDCTCTHCACAFAFSCAHVDQGGKINATATRLGTMDCAP